MSLSKSDQQLIQELSVEVKALRAENKALREENKALLLKVKDLEEKLNELAIITKECFDKDSSENHQDWLINFACNRFGLNNFCAEAKNVILINWK